MSSTFHSSTSAMPDAYSGTSKVAIVTGVSSGIGLEVTNRLVAKGHRVVANSRNISSAMTLQATGELKLWMSKLPPAEYVECALYLSRLGGTTFIRHAGWE